jgi:hypothetical protein
LTGDGESVLTATQIDHYDTFGFVVALGVLDPNHPA